MSPIDTFSLMFAGVFVILLVAFLFAMALGIVD